MLCSRAAAPEIGGAAVAGHISAASTLVTALLRSDRPSRGGHTRMPSRLVSHSLPARPRHPPGHAAPSWRRPRRSTGCLAHPGASPGSNCSPHWTTLPELRPKPPREQPSLRPQPWTTTPAPSPIPQWTTPQTAAAPTEPSPPAVPSHLPTRRPGHSSWTSRNPPGPIWREALPAPTPPVTHLGRVPAPAAPTILSKKDSS